MSLTQCAHATVGRLRVKVAAVKGAPRKAPRLEAKISGIRGVVKVTANPTTGSVLILYNTRRTAHPELLRRLSRLGLSGTPEAKPKIVRTVAENLFRSAVEVALERLLLALV